MSNLLPCPFCGSEDIRLHDAGFCLCNKCDSFGPLGGNEAWNSRAPLLGSTTQQAAAAVLAAQEAKGLSKYGTTLDDAGLSEIEIAEHAQQEAADLLMYLTARVELMKKGAKP